MLNLDTHILLFALDGSLTPAERKLLASEPWGISAIVLWEVAKLAQLGRIAIDVRSTEFVRIFARVQVWPLDLAVCEKSVQFHYERVLRPADRQHEPWAERVRGQLFAGLEALEREINAGKGWLFEDRMLLPDITLATAFAFTQGYLSDIVDKTRFGAIASLSARAEDSREFRAAPPEDGAIALSSAR